MGKIRQKILRRMTKFYQTFFFYLIKQVIGPPLFQNTTFIQQTYWWRSIDWKTAALKYFSRTRKWKKYFESVPWWFGSQHTLLNLSCSSTCQLIPHSYSALGRRVRGLTLRAGSSLAVSHASPTARRDELKVGVMRGNGVAVAKKPGLLRCELSRVSRRKSAVESQVRHILEVFTRCTWLASLWTVSTWNRLLRRWRPVGFSSSLPTQTRLTPRTWVFSALIDRRAGWTAGEALAPAASCFGCWVTVAGVRNLIFLPILLHFLQQSFLEIEISKFAVFPWRVAAARKANFDASSFCLMRPYFWLILFAPLIVKYSPADIRRMNWASSLTPVY